MTKSRGINRSRWRPTADQLALIRDTFPDTKTADIASQLGVEYHQVSRLAGRLGLKKSAAFLNGTLGGRTDGTRGTGCRFQKGHVPWIKGRRVPGHGGGTHFKPGEKPPNFKPIGSHRIAGGYVQRKVTDTGYPPRDWVFVHRIVWEEAHGPIPEGHVVTFLPGRRSTDLAAITADALELISMRELMHRNSVNRLPKELADLAKLRGALVRKINGMRSPA
jgi:hypothetical protein